MNMSMNRVWLFFKKKKSKISCETSMQTFDFLSFLLLSLFLITHVIYLSATLWEAESAKRMSNAK